MASGLPNFKAAFNSLCGHASVNHLHWHFYYLRDPYRLPGMVTVVTHSVYLFSFLAQWGESFSKHLLKVFSPKRGDWFFTYLPSLIFECLWPLPCKWLYLLSTASRSTEGEAHRIRVLLPGRRLLRPWLCLSDVTGQKTGGPFQASAHRSQTVLWSQCCPQHFCYQGYPFGLLNQEDKSDQSFHLATSKCVWSEKSHGAWLDRGRSGH